MILEEETFKEFGYRPNELTTGSHKSIIAACDKCGKTRILPMYGYHALCHSCSNKAENNGMYGVHRYGSDNPFFGRTHSEESKKAMGDSKRGEKSSWFGKYHTEDTKTKMSESAKEVWSDPCTRKCPIRGRKRETNIERTVREQLEKRDITYEQEKGIGHRFHLDFYLPEQNIAIECDGTFWHSLPGAARRDKRKENVIKSLGMTLVRLPEAQIIADDFEEKFLEYVFGTTLDFFFFNTSSKNIPIKKS